MKSLAKNNGGFISIIAIGVFALLMIFAISLQMTIIDTFNNLKNSQNRDAAQDIADSTIEYLQSSLGKFAPGLNDSVTCAFDNGVVDTTNTNANSSPVCPTSSLKNLSLNHKVKVEIKVVGRASVTLTSAKWSNPYVTPVPGSGDAGKNCKFYTPNSTSSAYIDASLNNGINVDQLDYTCNWNKLSLGSSQTDRVAIPLYYESAKLGDETTIINPFLTGAANPATKLSVKMRTPCKPCGPIGSTNVDSDYQRLCTTQPKDETLCADTERYQLDAITDLKTGKTDDIVVQWLINGECKNATTGAVEACGVMPSPKLADTSALFESRIVKNSAYPLLTDYEVIGNKTLAYDSNNYPAKIYLLNIVKVDISTVKKLPSISKPVLTLFLNKPLLTAGKHNIPYLEYQVLTDQPISSNQVSLEATVTVDGNTFSKTLTQQVEKPLIDFAIHN